MGRVASVGTSLRTLREVDPSTLRGRRVMVRADFNVPLTADGSVTDDTRVRETLPTLRLLMDAGARIIILSHLGRPKGVPDPQSSLEPVGALLSELLEATVEFIPACSGPEVKASVASLANGEILLLENTRFLPGETGNSPELAGEWATLAQDYVGDAFGSAHRAHASTEGVARAILAQGGRAMAGLLLEREVHFLRDAMSRPERPFVAVMGGAKISGKIDVIRAILPRVDRLLLGGAMANTFFRALGLEVGASLMEEDSVHLASELMEEAGDRLVLPVDVRVADTLSRDAEVQDRPRDEVRPGEIIGDVGPDTQRIFHSILSEARTVIWNGPVGVFELPPFAQGSLALARSVAQAGGGEALTVVGGGDSVAAAAAAGVTEAFSHVSTGGGASLELLAGKSLPGVAVLEKEE
ncbi:MAG: phosphoglycerate kinase [Gemmatimonadota bacterium]